MEVMHWKTVFMLAVSAFNMLANALNSGNALTMGISADVI